MKYRVVITGMGIVTACGIGTGNNWSAIASGTSAVKEIESFDSSRYRGRCGGEAREFTCASLKNLDGKRLDRASHLLIHTAGDALETAGMAGTIRDKETLVSLGTTLGGMLSGQKFHRDVMNKGLRKARTSLVYDYMAHYQPVNLFKEFNLKGDSILFSDACASGTNAIGHAFRCVQNGKYRVALCGGYDTMSEFTFAGFNSLMAVSPGMCRPFDINRDGLVLGEGAGMLVLENLQHARERNADIIAEVIGYGESSDGYHMTSPEPSGQQASRAINNALAEAGWPEIDYINAHGTGTKFNDSMETAAILNSFGEKGRTIPVSSIKPAIGHLLGGAGAVEAVISILAIRNKMLPPNLNYVSPDPECELNIVKEAVENNVTTVISNSFGFGGSNASLIMREY